MVVDIGCVGLSMSETVDPLRFSQATISTDSREWSGKEKRPNERGSLGALLRSEVNRKAEVFQISTPGVTSVSTEQETEASIPPHQRWTVEGWSNESGFLLTLV